jgi:hypothetical protein
VANRAIAQAFTASFPALQTQPETRDRNHNVDLPKWGSSTYLDKQYCLSDHEDSSAMAVTRIIANLSAPDPMALAKFYVTPLPKEDQAPNCLSFRSAWMTSMQPRSRFALPALRSYTAQSRNPGGFAASFSVIQPVISSMLSIAEALFPAVRHLAKPDQRTAGFKERFWRRERRLCWREQPR